MISNVTPTTVDETTTDILDRASVDRAALARLDLDTISVDDLAAWLYDHGATHLSAIERIELAERLITRRRFIIGAGGLLGAAALGACGAGDEAVAPTSTEESATRTFVDSAGREIVVPNRAQRIVATNGLNGIDQLLSLNAPVIGFAKGNGVREDISRYFGDLEDVADVGTYENPNLERIVALNPDLIVVTAGQLSFLDASIVERLEEVAPVVEINTFRPVEEVMSDFIGLLGGNYQERLSELEAEFEQKLDELRAVLGDAWSQVTAAEMGSTDEGIRVHGPTAIPRTDVLTRIGVSWIPLVEEAGARNSILNGISLERIEEFASDLLIIYTAFNDTILAEPLYQSLDVVQADQVVEFSEPASGNHYQNYIYVIEQFLEQLAGKTIRTDIV